MAETNPLQHFEDDELLWFLSEGLMLTDMEGAILSLNDAGSSIFGYGNHLELTGRNVRDLFWKPEDFGMLVDTIKKTREIREYLILGRKRDGRPAYVQASSRLHPFDAERPEGIATMFKDVSERELFKRAIERSEDRYRSLFNNISEGYVRFGADNRVVFMNPAAAKMLGFNSSMDVVGETLLDFWESEEARKGYIERIQAAGEVVGEKIAMRLRDGRRVTLEVTERAMRNREGEIVGSDALFRDVTEQEALQERLVESSQKYYEIVNNSSDIIVVTDKENVPTYINPAFEKILGYPVTGEAGRLLRDTLAEGEADKIDRAIEQLLAGRSITGLEVKHIGSSGREVFLSWNASPLRDKAGRVTGIIGVGRDMTERKQAEEVLREGERFLSNIFASIQDGISILDTDLNVIRANPTVERWYAHASPLAGKKCYEVYHGRSEPCEVCPSQRTIEKREVAHEVVPKKGPGGEAAGWLDLYSFPLLDTETGELKGVIEYVRDITEQRRAEEELREERAFSQNIIETANSMVIVLDRGGKIEVFNKFAEELSGYKREEAVGKDYFDLLPPADMSATFRERFLTFIRSGGPVTGFGPIVCRDGGEKFIMWSRSVLRDTEGNALGVIAVGKDITERRRAEKALEEQHNFTEAILNTAAACIVVLDPEGRISRMNRSLQELSGYSEEEMKGKPFWDYMVPKNLVEAARKTVGETFAAGKPTRGKEFPMLCKSGEVRIIAWRSDFIRDAEGRPIRMVSLGRDITETIELRKKVERSERLYRSLVENSPDIILRTDAAGKIVFSGGAGPQLTGHEDAEVLGRSILEFVHPQDCAAASDALAQAAGGKNVGNLVCRSITKSGDAVHLNVNARPVANEEGDVAEIQITCRDITPLIRLQEELREYSTELEKKVEERTGQMREAMEKRAQEERHTAQLFEIAPLAFIGTDENRIIRQWNRAAQEIFGWTPEEAIGRPATIMVPPDKMQDCDNVSSSIRRGEVVKGYENAGITKDGRRIDLKMDAVSLLDENGRHVRGLCMMEDITRKKAVQREMEQARARLQMILEEIPEYGIFSTDANFVINYFGPGCETLLGWKAEEVIGREYSYVLGEQPPSGTAGQALHEALLGGSSVSEIISMRRRDGSAVKVSAAVKPILDRKGGGQGIVAVLRDLSREGEILDRLFEDAHHKALGAVVVGLAAKFEEALGRLERHAMIAAEDSAYSSRLASEVREEVERARDLLGLLMGFSHPIAQPFQLLDAGEVADEVARLLQGEFQMSGVRLIRTYHKVGETLMRKEEIQNALLNLLVAGMAAAGKGGAVELLVRQEEDGIVLSVRDNGEGIAREKLGRIFDPKFWVDQPSAERQSKTLTSSLGLGLISARRTAEGHGGTVEVESEIGVGTCYRIKLPVRITRRGRKTTRVFVSPAHVAKPATLPLRVLIANDERHIRSILAHVVKEWQHIPDVAAGLAEARTLCAEHKFDVLFMDAELGDQDAVSGIIAQARAANPRVRVVLIAERPQELPPGLVKISEKVLAQSFSVEEIHRLLSV